MRFPAATVACLPLGLALVLSGCASAPARNEGPADTSAPVDSGRSAGTVATAGRIRVETADQLPRRAYPVDTTASTLLQDENRFEALADRLEADIHSDLATYDIRDKATLKGYYGTLDALAIHRRDYDAAVAYADSVRALEDKPGVRLMTGVVEHALADASRVPTDQFQAVFRQSFQRRVEGLPYQQVHAELASTKGMLEVFSRNFLIGMAKAQMDPVAEGGEISMGLAQQLVGLRAALDRMGPVQQTMIEVLGEAMAAHAVEKADIWAARDVSLQDRPGLTPVTVAIWDSGVDPKLFPHRLYTNPAETPGNGRDDDENGYVDDVHGIAHGLHSERTTGELFSLTLTPAEAGEYQTYLQGLSDLQANLDSPAAQELKRKIAATPPEGLNTLLEGLSQFSNYAHGTHVAGIASRGDPAVRLLVARMTFPWHTVPELPTVELAYKSARESRETVEYFEEHGVRVVNMSWEATPASVESALEANHAGGTPDERRRLARLIFDIGADTLRNAIASASNILFVAAAGNDDADNRFSEAIPASFDLPNLITAGAVDQAGDEAAFTSYGKADVYANGYEVRSTVPGGDTIPLSGTSMAAPQVVNLAAKLLALRPDLTVAELRAAIVDAADEKTIGQGKTIRLLDPKASVERVLARER
jgi:subtilisin family serine protease